VDLVGHSYGGLLALLVARANPSQIRSLALYDPVAFGTLDPVQDEAALRSLEQVPAVWEGSEAGRERWLQAFVDYWGGAGAWPALRNEVRDEFRRVGWAVYQGVATLVRDRTPASAYGVIEAPVLLLGGEKTPFAARRVVEHLKSSLPRARVVTVASAGHMGPLTHADVVNEAIAGWLSGGSGASPPPT
jgi:pimeloyl-ACP methyl ester carboxylesterase